MLIYKTWQTHLLYSIIEKSAVKISIRVVDEFCRLLLTTGRVGANEIIIWQNIDRNVLQNYAVNSSNPHYLSYLSSMEKLQLREENGTVPPQALPRIIGSNTKNNNNSGNNYHPLVMLGFAYFLESV